LNRSPRLSHVNHRLRDQPCPPSQHRGIAAEWGRGHRQCHTPGLGCRCPRMSTSAAPRTLVMLSLRAARRGPAAARVAAQGVSPGFLHRVGGPSAQARGSACGGFLGAFSPVGVPAGGRAGEGSAQSSFAADCSVRRDRGGYPPTPIHTGRTDARGSPQRTPHRPRNGRQ
jgi:hypothetical protein